MKKLFVIKIFRDSQTDLVMQPGDDFEADDKRADELINLGFAQEDSSEDSPESELNSDEDGAGDSQTDLEDSAAEAVEKETAPAKKSSKKA